MNPKTTAATATRDAALWTLRCDRGLSASEQDELSQWLAGDPRHRDAFGEHRRGWDELDRLAGLQTSVQAVPDPDLLAPARNRRLRRFVPIALGLAAAVVLGLGFLRSRAVPDSGPATAAAALALIERRTLSDGSVLELNRGAVVTGRFTAQERRVALERGEAHFKVAHDAARPFMVEAGGVTVRAVGTAFTVQLDPTRVRVLVTEGKVRVDDSAKGQSLLGAAVDGEPPVLSAGQSAVVTLAPTAVSHIGKISATEIATQLAWQPRLLDFTDAPLAEIVGAFNRGNPVRLVLADAALGEMRLSATFRSDNVEGFVHLMESDFGLHAERTGDRQIVLRRAVRP